MRSATEGNKRDQSGATRLLEAGELLFGRHGLDGPTMQQIRIAAGSSNKYAVQYHFGGIDGLIDAILAARMPVVDKRQAEMLADVEAKGLEKDVRALLDAFFRPLLEQVNSRGELTYACFMSAMLVSADGARHLQTMDHLAPTTYLILERLRTVLPAVPPAMMSRRLRLVTGMVCADLFTTGGAMDDPQVNAAVEDTLNMAAAALSAPAS